MLIYIPLLACPRNVYGHDGIPIIFYKNVPKCLHLVWSNILNSPKEGQEEVCQ